MAKHQRETISILKFWGFIGIHFVPLLAIFTGTFSFDWALALALYVIRMFFITAGYHRYFSHRTFKTSRRLSPTQEIDEYSDIIINKAVAQFRIAASDII